MVPAPFPEGIVLPGLILDPYSGSKVAKGTKCFLTFIHLHGDKGIEWLSVEAAGKDICKGMETTNKRGKGFVGGPPELCDESPWSLLIYCW